MRSRKTPILGTSACCHARRNGPASDVAPGRIGVPPGSLGLICGSPQGARNVWIPDRSRRARDIAIRQVPAVQLLATVPVGRVSFLADGEIVVLPVNHVVDGQDPVFCTASGSKLSAAGERDLVAFEADEYDKRTRSGWSVLVNGRAQAVYDEAEIQRLNHLGLHPWVTAVDRPFWIRIRPASISGRQTPGAS